MFLMRAPRQACRVLSASVKHCWNTCEGERVNPPAEAQTSFRSVLYTRARNMWRNGTPSVTHTKVKSSEHALQSVLEMQVKRNQNIHCKKKKRRNTECRANVRKKTASIGRKAPPPSQRFLRNLQRLASKPPVYSVRLSVQGTRLCEHVCHTARASCLAHITLLPS